MTNLHIVLGGGGGAKNRSNCFHHCVYTGGAIVNMYIEAQSILFRSINKSQANTRDNLMEASVSGASCKCVLCFSTEENVRKGSKTTTNNHGLGTTRGLCSLLIPRSNLLPAYNLLIRLKCNNDLGNTIDL